MLNYTARIYSGVSEVNSESGDNLGKLYYGMMSRFHGEFGNFRGAITDNKTHQIIITFNTCSLE